MDTQKNIIKKYINELRRNGLTKKEASDVVAEYIEADKVGQLSHGTMFLPNLIRKIKRRGGPVKVLKNSGPLVYLDGQRELGQIAAEKAVLIITKKARQYGIGIVALKNILSFMRPGTYVKKLAENNLFGIAMIDGGTPLMAHPDSPVPVISTNPIGFGVPTEKGPLVIDMATSKRNWSEVKYAILKGTKLAPDTYKDINGKFTTDPKKAYSVVPFGDYKGFALGLVIEILCGAFLDMKMGKNKETMNKEARSRSAIFIAIDPSKFTSINKFKGEVSNFLNQIKRVKRNRGVKNLRIPGEASMRLK